MQVLLKDRRGGAGKPTYPLSDFQGSCFFPGDCAYQVLQAAEHSAPLQCLSLQITIAHTFRGRNAILWFRVSLQEKWNRTEIAMCSETDFVSVRIRG